MHTAAENYSSPTPNSWKFCYKEINLLFEQIIRDVAGLQKNGWLFFPKSLRIKPASRGRFESEPIQLRLRCICCLRCKIFY